MEGGETSRDDTTTTVTEMVMEMVKKMIVTRSHESIRK